MDMLSDWWDRKMSTSYCQRITYWMSVCRDHTIDRTMCVCVYHVCVCHYLLVLVLVICPMMVEDQDIAIKYFVKFVKNVDQEVGAF